MLLNTARERRFTNMAYDSLSLLNDVPHGTESTRVELDECSGRECQSILSSSAGPSTDYSQACVHKLFEDRASASPHHEAVVYGDKSLTYRELDRQSNQIARFLRAEGIRAEDRIGIFMNRSQAMIVAMLGILKSGGAYVPIDRDYPSERINFIARDAELRIVLTEHNLAQSIETAARCICVDTLDSPIYSHNSDPVTDITSPEGIAVLSYTSGSTGQPKAALIPHRAIVRTVRNTNYIQVSAEDRISQAGSPSFDAAIMEIWLALLNGATVVGVNRETLLSPAALSETLKSRRVNILILNTSYVHQIACDQPDALMGVRKVIFGGEAAEPVALRKLLAHVGPDVLLNTYGPAEGCVITSYYEIAEILDGAKTIPIGRAVSNTQIYLLDSSGQPVPVGAQGEIYIGGDGVARGYLNRPGLTEERFVPDSFSGKPNGRLYRTGDFARMLPDGNIEFVGRVDEQIKIRGHRIELAEVRHAIVSDPGVRQVHLMVREDTPGDKRLVAYVVGQPGAGITQESLRQHVIRRLPAEMVPAAFVLLDFIPLTVNGKVDRSALPSPQERPVLESVYQMPETEIERKLMLIWRQVLRLDRVGVDDNFFDLGGHSLLAARLIARIEKQLGINIPTATLFDAPTIRQLGRKLAERTYRTSWSPLVELYAPENATRSKPFFCIHSLGANLISFHNVAALMRGDRPIYGLQPHGLDGSQNPLDSIESMAASYLEEIRKKQPGGPYFLGGVCLGGVIAYEIAQQLQAAGETVAFLALIDSYVPGKTSYLYSRSSLLKYLDRHLGNLLRRGFCDQIKYLARWIGNGGVRLRRVLGMRDRSSVARATRKIAKAHVRALMRYKPNSYSGKLVLLMCGDAAHRSYEDSRLAWSSLATSGLEVRLVPGDHLTMVEEPNARILARQLQSCLDSVAGGNKFSEDIPKLLRLPA